MKDLTQNARAVEARLREMTLNSWSENTADTIAALCTALEAATADAARYRWLRERLYKDGADVCASVSNAYDIYSGSLSEIFDTAIDAAMKEQPVKPKAQRLAEINAEIAAHLKEDEE